MSAGDHVAMTMLAMAETLRQLQPPKVKMAIKCTKYEMMTRMGEYFMQPRLEALTLICEALIHGPPNAASSNRMLTLIRSELANAKAFPTIYAKLFFYYI
ncbi:hypothetical protein TELCIR_22737, partial [Teladorsagia circumcincta]